MAKSEHKKKQIEKIIRAEDPWEPVGPTPMPDMTELRNWDRRLMETYKPFYAPDSDVCGWCTYGKCDLTGEKKGACGINIRANRPDSSLCRPWPACRRTRRTGPT